MPEPQWMLGLTRNGSSATGGCLDGGFGGRGAVVGMESMMRSKSNLPQRARRWQRLFQPDGRKFDK